MPNSIFWKPNSDVADSAAAEAKKGSIFRVGGSRIPTFVCMSKINHWGVGVTKLRDDIAGSVCDSHKAPFSKMAAINTITHNKVMQNVKNTTYSTSKSTFSESRNAMVTSNMPHGE